MAKTLEEIMSEVTNGNDDYINVNDCIKIAKLYANQKLEEAADRHDDTHVSLTDYENAKQSILNLREEV